MKRVLLDTHAFLWWLADDPSLGAVARAVIADGRNEIYLSAASVWEISIKQALGKLEAPDDLEKVAENENFIRLPISLFHAESAGKLPPLHNDPFDRMLVAQAQAEGLSIMTADEHIPRYGVRTVSARE
ncbi:MAG: type II toxin-antitoxin system VapC family toxin [Ectothiorhodospiraceae bacterium]|nr:type II toxin-antitoxin system VapC family toxin [Ectothiorhodospiraceae bacterium]